MLQEKLELSRPRTQLRVIHINGCLNFTMTQGKANLPRGTRRGGGRRGCFGYPRPYKSGLSWKQTCKETFAIVCLFIVNKLCATVSNISLMNKKIRFLCSSVQAHSHGSCLLSTFQPIPNNIRPDKD